MDGEATGKNRRKTFFLPINPPETKPKVTAPSYEKVKLKWLK